MEARPKPKKVKVKTTKTPPPMAKAKERVVKNKDGTITLHKIDKGGFNDGWLWQLPSEISPEDS